MAGHRKFSEIRGELSPERRERMERKKEELLVAMRLEELARRRRVRQEDLAEKLETSQANVSRRLRNPDPHISTLREYVEALGGELQLVASFPDGDRVRLVQFEEADREEA